MKIENMSKVRRIEENYANAKKAYDQVSILLARNPIDCDGGVGKGQLPIYQLYLSEFKDKSGFCLDLTGVCVGVDLLKSLQYLLQERMVQMEKEIADL